MIQVSKQQARKFLLKKQLLWPPQSLSGKDAIGKVFETLRVIQYDPLNPCGRNTDIVLQARISDYHPEGYFDWLYKEKKGIECYDKELCIIPIEDVPLTFHDHEKTANEKRILLFFKNYQRDIEVLLQFIHERGPISSADIADKRQVDTGWGVPGLFGRVALDILWRTGRLVISKRERGRKFYDLPDRVYGKRHAYDEKLKYDIMEEHILRRVRSVGLLAKSGSGTAWQGMGIARKNGVIVKKLIDEEKLVEVTIEEVKTKYVVLAKDESLMKEMTPLRQGFAEQGKRMVFIAPLDTLMWDRKMVEELFGFYYRWEVYVPERKRQWGYYVLPILYGDEFVGRVEPVFQKGKLIIKKIWKEKEWDSEIEDQFERALEQFAKYLQAEEIIKQYE